LKRRKDSVQDLCSIEMLTTPGDQQIWEKRGLGEGGDAENKDQEGFLNFEKNPAQLDFPKTALYSIILAFINGGRKRKGVGREISGKRRLLGKRKRS